MELWTVLRCRYSSGHQGEHQTAVSLAASLLWPKDIPKIHRKKVFHLSLCLRFLWFPVCSRIHDLKMRQLSVAPLWPPSPVISCQMCLGPLRAAGDRFCLGTGGRGEWNQHDASHCPSQPIMIACTGSSSLEVRVKVARVRVILPRVVAPVPGCPSGLGGLGVCTLWPTEPLPVF